MPYSLEEFLPSLQVVNFNVFNDIVGRLRVASLDLVDCVARDPRDFAKYLFFLDLLVDFTGIFPILFSRPTRS